MTLKGFIVHSWLGYISGFLFLKKPWGNPSFKSWKSLLVLWSVLVFVLQTLIFYDLRANVDTLLHTKEINPILKYLNELVLGCSFLSFIFFRIIFIRYAKLLAKLMNKLSRYQFYKTPSKGWKYWWFQVYISSALSLMALIVQSVLFGLSGGKTAIFPKIGEYVSITQFLVYLTVMPTRSASFVIIISISLHIGMIFDDFCTQLEDELLGNKHNDGPTTTTKCRFPVAVVKIKDIQRFTAYELLKIKYEEMIRIAEVASRILRQLTLTLVGTSVWILISSTYTAFVGQYDSSGTLLAFTTAAEQFIYLGLVFVGEKIKDVIKLRKSQIHRLLILRPDLQISKGKSVELAKLSLLFEWKLAACAVFDIDRRLLSGIMSTALNYIVILFQFQFAVMPVAKYNSTLNYSTKASA